jgi:23S rRNA pseudouridine1911/1915/1917 synthase
MGTDGHFAIAVEVNQAGLRLDSVIAQVVEDCSRARASQLIKGGHITVDGVIRKPGYRVKSGEVLSGVIPAPQPIDCLPEEIPLAILHEDRDLIVVNKPAGMVVHPAPGNYSGTLVNALLAHSPDIQGIGGELRPGIVHRLDKETSGAIVVAKNSKAHQSLSDQFQSRQIEKGYLAVVHGEVAECNAVIQLAIGRHPVDRKKMSIHSHRPREAETRWRVKAVYPQATLLALELLTGRTHQIRVHVAAKGHPIVGDGVYRHKSIEKRMSKPLTSVDRLLSRVQRQMLHAWRLSLDHPVSGERLQFTAPLPTDFEELLCGLRTLKDQ